MSAHEFLQAGAFNLRLTLQAQTLSGDGCGGTVGTWQPQFDLWARIVPVKGIVVVAAGEEQREHTHWIYTRKRSGIEPGMRFVGGQRTFDIDTVRDPDESGRYWVCRVSEIDLPTEGNAT